MKKIAFYLFWTFICLHTTVSFADAATGTIDASLAQVDAIIADTESGITLESAPVLMYRQAITPIYQTEFTAWELVHRTPMIQGFAWSGEIANFITPAMYIGTPLQTNMSDAGYDTSIGATNYSECVRMETDTSFGVDGELIEETVEDELRSIAKHCARSYLGSYFDGREYTTREEMLMLIFTMFDTDIYLPGYFDETEFVFDGEETEVAYTNVSSRAWFAPYLSLAYDLMMVEDEGRWTVAHEVTDEDLVMMFDMYLTDEDGVVGESVETEYGTYTI